MDDGVDFDLDHHAWRGQSGLDAREHGLYVLENLAVGFDKPAGVTHIRHIGLGFDHMTHFRSDGAEGILNLFENVDRLLVNIERCVYRTVLLHRCCPGDVHEWPDALGSRIRANFFESATT